MTRSDSEDLRILQVPPGELVPSADNPRQMSASQGAALERSVSEFGLVDPIIARREDRTVIGGHQRLAVAKKLGLARVPVVFLDLTQAQAKTLCIGLNKIQGEWNLEQLGEVLAELRDLPDIDVGLTGFDTEELEDLFAELEGQRPLPELEEEIDLASELSEAETGTGPTRVQRGELWQLGPHRLYCGDSLAEGALARLCGGRQVPVVLTDPPYGIDYQSRMTRPGKEKAPIANDDFDQFERFLERALPAVRQTMMSGGTLYWFSGAGGTRPVLALAMLAIARHFTLQNVLAWDKETPGLGWHWRSSWDAIIEATVGERGRWYGGTHRRNVLRWHKLIPAAGDHPTPKPAELLAELMRVSSRAGEVVLDPFVGSGSTLMAAELTGRTCFAAELEHRYCDLVLKRWESVTGKQARLMEEAADEAVGEAAT